MQLRGCLINSIIFAAEQWKCILKVVIHSDPPFSQEVEPICAADLCSLWTNSEDPEAHVPTIPARRKTSESAAARYNMTPSLRHVTSSNLHVTSHDPTACSGLNSCCFYRSMSVFVGRKDSFYPSDIPGSANLKTLCRRPTQKLIINTAIRFELS